MGEGRGTGDPQADVGAGEATAARGLGPRLARVFGALDLGSALVTALGVFAGLPARWWPVDVAAAVIVALLGAAGAGLLAGAPWAARVARIASLVTLGAGLVLIALLAFTASYLSGVYGPVGRGGALILVLVAALALPYLVAFPASQLLWLGRLGRLGRRRPAAPARARSSATPAASAAP